MIRKLNFGTPSGKEIYTVSIPADLLRFTRFDFFPFYESTVNLCKMYAKTGDCDLGDLGALRETIKSCHKYVGANIRGVFANLPIDCMLSYIRRQSGQSETALWSLYMKCRNPFETALFTRLSEFRHKKAVNEWDILMRARDYAVSKTEFIFGKKCSSPLEAGGRANCFDLMYNVAANELGFDNGILSETNVSALGRVPNSHFILSELSREILKDMFKDLPSGERQNGYSQDADAFSAWERMKKFFPQVFDATATTIAGRMNGIPKKVYVPHGLKAVIDLEIDALIESGAVIQKCENCGEYFVRDAEYDFDYCQRRMKDGKTCLEYAKEENYTGSAERQTAFAEYTPVVTKTTFTENEEGVTPPPETAPPLGFVQIKELSVRREELYREMAARVGDDMTQRDLSLWNKELIEIYEKVSEGYEELAWFDKFAFESKTRKFAAPQPKTIVKPTAENGATARKIPFNGNKNGLAATEKKITEYSFPKIASDKILHQPKITASDLDDDNNDTRPIPSKVLRGTPNNVGKAVVIPTDDPLRFKKLIESAKTEVPVKPLTSLETQPSKDPPKIKFPDTTRGNNTRGNNGQPPRKQKYQEYDDNEYEDDADYDDYDGNDRNNRVQKQRRIDDTAVLESRKERDALRDNPRQEPRNDRNKLRDDNARPKVTAPPREPRQDPKLAPKPALPGVNRAVNAYAKQGGVSNYRDEYPMLDDDDFAEEREYARELMPVREPTNTRRNPDYQDTQPKQSRQYTSKTRDYDEDDDYDSAYSDEYDEYDNYETGYEVKRREPLPRMPRVAAKAVPRSSNRPPKPPRDNDGYDREATNTRESRTNRDTRDNIGARDNRDSEREHQSREPEFTEYLRGAARGDGFGDSDANIPLDAQGVPTSHKTKRVLDAVLGTPKPKKN